MTTTKDWTSDWPTAAGLWLSGNTPYHSGYGDDDDGQETGASATTATVVVVIVGFCRCCRCHSFLFLTYVIMTQ